MSNPSSPAASRPLPSSVDLGGIDTRHPDGESVLDLVGTAAAETAAGVSGVHHLGGLAARSLDRARHQLLGSSSVAGVTVAQDAGTTTIDLDVVAEYPSPLAALVEDLRAQVARAAGHIVGGRVVVNIVVTDVHGPFDQDPAVLDAIDEVGARATALGDGVSDRVGEARAGAADTAAAVGSRVKDLAEEAGKHAEVVEQRAGDTAAELQGQVRDAKDTAAATAKSLQDGLGRAAESADATLEGVRDDAADTVRDLQDAARSDDTDAAAGSRSAATDGEAASTTASLDAAVDDAARALDAAGEELERVRAEVRPDPTDARG